MIRRVSHTFSGPAYLFRELLMPHLRETYADTLAAVEADGVLRVRISDDGCGGADIDGGTGLLGLKDRVESLGGRFSVQSAPDAGSTVHVELPPHRDPGQRPTG